MERDLGPLDDDASSGASARRTSDVREVATEAAVLEADEADRAEMLVVAELMASMDASR